MDTERGVALLTGDGVRLAGRWWSGAARPRGVVVLCHGFGGSTGDPHLAATAERLAADGWDLLAFDSRGHGRSGGLCTLGDLERHDVAAAVALARTRHDSVVLVGASMGAVAVLRHAADDPGVSGVVLVSCPARWRLPLSWRGVAYAGITQTPVGRWLAARHLGARLARGWTWPDPPVALAARVGAPLAVVHGADDPFIPARAAHDLYAAASDPRRLDVVPGMGHAYSVAATPSVLAAVSWAADPG